MSHTEWYKNIPPQGVLCHAKNSMALIKCFDENDDTGIEDNGDYYHISDLTLLTAAEIWELMPWHDMQTAPLLKEILTVSKADFDDRDVMNITMLHDDNQRNAYKKWLPLPELNYV